MNYHWYVEEQVDKGYDEDSYACSSLTRIRTYSWEDSVMWDCTVN